MLKIIKKIVADILVAALFVTSITVIDRKEVKSANKVCEWNIECINAQNAYADSKKCSKIKVAVLDSGLDFDEDIPFVEREDFLGEEELSVMYQDYTGHGTCISGLICARENTQRVTGIASNVDLYMGRVLDENNEADVNRVIKAVQWAISKKVNIIHMSFGIKTYSEALNNVIQEAYRKGILIIAAAGNDGTADEDESTVEYPAAFENVIAVGCTNEKNKKSDFSSSGNEIDVVAPGEKILGTGVFSGIVVEEGTSLAAAQVTGVAAVLWGMHPDKSNEYIKEWIISSANDTIGKNCGNGMIDYEQTKRNYSWMEKNYQKNRDKGYGEEKSVEISAKHLPENKGEIEEHKVNYVVGTWNGSEHIKYVENAISKTKMSVNKSEINLIKLGAQMIDKLNATMGMKKNQCFHGGGNYVANTQYLYSMYRKYVDEDSSINNTKKYKKLEMLEYNSVFNGKNPYENLKVELKEKAKKNNKKAKSFAPYNIKKRLDQTQEIIFSKFIGRNKKKWTYKKRAYVILGMAIHTATDAFSHRVFKKVKINGKSAIWQTVHNSIHNKKKKTSVSKVWAELNRHSISKKHKTSVYSELMNKVMISDNVNKLKPLYYDSLLLAKKIISRANNKKNSIYVCYKNIGKRRSKMKKKKRKEVARYRVVDFKKNLEQFIKLEKNDWKYINYTNKNYKIKFAKKSVKYFKANKEGIKMKYNKNYIYGVYAVHGKTKKMLKKYKVKNGKIYFVYQGSKINYSKYNKIWVIITTPLDVKTFKINIKIGENKNAKNSKSRNSKSRNSKSKNSKSKNSKSKNSKSKNSKSKNSKSKNSKSKNSKSKNSKSKNSKSKNSKSKNSKSKNSKSKNSKSKKN